MSNKISEIEPLVSDVKTLIGESKQALAVTVNATLSMLYWQIGKRINDEVLQNKRAEYGQQVVKLLSEALIIEYGSGWSKRQLHHCLRFCEVFPDFQIVHTLCTQLSWSHIRLIIPIEAPLKREFYIEICKLEKWSVRTFQDRINSMLFERTAISKKPELTITNDLNQLKNEKQLSIDDDDYYIDLLFYHRRLKSLVAIDLKLGKFEASHKGQMELYLRWLEKHEMVSGENPPIGLILCASKNKEHIELLQLEHSNIKVAEYLTQLPDMKLLEERLHRAIEIARNKYSE